VRFSQTRGRGASTCSFEEQEEAFGRRSAATVRRRDHAGKCSGVAFAIFGAALGMAAPLRSGVHLRSVPNRRVGGAVIKAPPLPPPSSAVVGGGVARRPASPPPVPPTRKWTGCCAGASTRLVRRRRTAAPRWRWRPAFSCRRRRHGGLARSGRSWRAGMWGGTPRGRRPCGEPVKPCGGLAAVQRFLEVAKMAAARLPAATLDVMGATVVARPDDTRSEAVATPAAGGWQLAAAATATAAPGTRGAGNTPLHPRGHVAPPCGLTPHHPPVRFGGGSVDGGHQRRPFPPSLLSLRVACSGGGADVARRPAAAAGRLPTGGSGGRGEPLRRARRDRARRRDGWHAIDSPASAAVAITAMTLLG